MVKLGQVRFTLYFGSNWKKKKKRFTLYKSSLLKKLKIEKNHKKEFYSLNKSYTYQLYGFVWWFPKIFLILGLM